MDVRNYTFNVAAVEEDGKAAAADISPDVAMTQAEIWGYGFLFVTLINLSTVMGILFFPLKDRKIYWTVMRVMIGLAIGSLSGSALFHLIPKTLLLKPVTDEHLYTLGFLWISVWVVMILESALKIGLGVSPHQHEAIPETMDDDISDAASIIVQSNGISQYHITEGDGKDIESEQIPLEGEPMEKRVMDETDRATQQKLGNGQPLYHSTFSLSKKVVEPYRAEQAKPASLKDIKTVAWVIIFGDGIHNFVDGMSIGAAFTQSFNTGAAICLAIVCEEFPHELGDFAILINAGLSVKKALFFNFLSGMTCYLGLALGILLGTGFDWSHYIFAIAAGIFLHVALADMVPEVSEVISGVSTISKKKAWRILLTHHFGIAIGVTTLFLLAKYMPE